MKKNELKIRDKQGESQGREFLPIDIFSHVWYKRVMNGTTVIAYTPEQVAKMLQLSKNTVYDLIAKGEILAKRIGKAYRIPEAALSFVFTGLDSDLFAADREDRKNLKLIQKEISSARAKL